MIVYSSSPDFFVDIHSEITSWDREYLRRQGVVTRRFVGFTFVAWGIQNTANCMFVIDIIQNIEFCGLTIHDLDMEKRIIDVNKQLQRTSKMEYIIESTKTNAGTRKLPSARREQEKLNGVKEGKEKQSRKMFRVV